jgi:hypothetical protein
MVLFADDETVDAPASSKAAPSPKPDSPIRKPRRASVIANLRKDEALALVARKLADHVGDRDGMAAMREVFMEFDVGKLCLLAVGISPNSPHLCTHRRQWRAFTRRVCCRG